MLLTMSDFQLVCPAENCEVKNFQLLMTTPLMRVLFLCQSIYAIKLNFGKLGLGEI